MLKDWTRPSVISRIAFQFRLMRIDVKHHQNSTCCPFPAILQTNVAQDEPCNNACSWSFPQHIRIPNSGSFVLVCTEHRISTQNATQFVCSLFKNIFSTNTCATCATKTDQHDVSNLAALFAFNVYTSCSASETTPPH